MGDTLSKCVKKEGDKAKARRKRQKRDQNEAVKGDLKRVFKDYLQPDFLPCWENIIPYITLPTDVVALSNASPKFNKWISQRKTAALLSLALPIVIPQATFLSTNDVLRCRLLSKALKQTLDNALPKTIPNLFMDNYTFETAQQIQHFMRHAENIVGNPVLGKFIVLIPINAEAWIAALEMLEKYGHVLVHLLITPFLDPRLPLPLALSYCQNLESLSVGLEWSAINLPQNKLLSPRSFPQLAKLVELRMHFDQDEDLRSAAPLLYSFIRVYGPRLKIFKCFQNIFLSGLSAQSFSILFPNLEELELIGLDGRSAQVFEIFSNVKWPKIQLLSLKEHWDKSKCEDIKFTKHSVKSLDTFKNSLKELTLAELDDKQFNQGNDIYSGFQQGFAGLKTFNVCASNFMSPMWNLLTTRFVNLERLTFRRSKTCRFVPLMYIETMEEFFVKFPKLQEILWPTVDVDTDVGEKYIVFQRQENCTSWLGSLK
ncbi:unnamed protein product [Orchesella dallaii]|uniref:F-box domain-containing protein n=1 Tax=Orchesella dallaii TaxID=48710 RepID=A0ABP1Q5X0_9HEXA